MAQIIQTPSGNQVLIQSVLDDGTVTLVDVADIPGVAFPSSCIETSPGGSAFLITVDDMLNATAVLDTQCVPMYTCPELKAIIKQLLDNMAAGLTTGGKIRIKIDDMEREISMGSGGGDPNSALKFFLALANAQGCCIGIDAEEALQGNGTPQWQNMKRRYFNG